MKRDINLLYKKAGHEKKRLYFVLFRKITVITAISSIAIFTVLLLVEFYINHSYSGLLATKESKLQELVVLSEREKTASFYNVKSQQMVKILKKDVNFIPYLKALQDSLPSSSESGSIKSINFSANKSAQITFSFKDPESLNSFLATLEDDQFLSLFETLQIRSFSVSGHDGANYQLVLDGKFVPKKDENDI